MKEHARPAHAPSEGLLRFQAQPVDPHTWIGPAWAALCGLIASGGFKIMHGADWLRLALLILLADGAWGTLWTAVGFTDWASPLGRWRTWKRDAPMPRPPYTLPGSPGDRALRWVGLLRAWWQHTLWPGCGTAVAAIVITLPVTALLGALLGLELLLLSVAALAVMQLALAWHRGQGHPAPEWNAIIAIALPWLSGHVAFRPLTLSSAGLALASTVAWGMAWRVDSRWGRALYVAGSLVAATILVALRHPLAAGAVLLLLVPQLALLPWPQRGQPAAWYVRHTRYWLMAAMLVAAGAL